MDDEVKKEIDPARAALVKEWTEKVQETRKEREETFKQMRESMDFAARGCDKDWLEEKKYVVPILPRYINQAVATIYAKNPKTVWKRRPRLRYVLWDGRQDSVEAAMQLAQMGDAQAMAMLEEVLKVRTEELLLDRMGETLNIAWQYFLSEQSANYKQQLKSWVRRAKICKVAWLGLTYQRAMQPNVGVEAQINDVTSKIVEIEAQLKEMQEDPNEGSEQEAEMEQLRLNLADLERDRNIVVREGPVLYFPRSDTIIVDKNCTHLKSLTGADWIAEEFEYCPDKIKKLYGVDIGDKYKNYAKDEGKKGEKKNARVWRIWDKVNQQVCTICEGHDDFLKEPATPEIWMERFFPLFPLVFNEVEHYEDIYPSSDVEQAKHIQLEYNRSRESLRQHRIAAQPWWVESVGMTADEKTKVSTRAPHTMVSIPALTNGAKISDAIQAGPTAPVDMNLYETETHFNDLLRSVGYQEAQIGSTSGATATESSIAQQSQSASQADNVDDLDSVMTDLSRAAGQVMYLNMTKEMILKIVGEGAAWPDTEETRQAAAEEISLEVEAGSSGRPNQAADLANVERAMPYLIQLPGINPKPLAEKYAKLLDIPKEELYADTVPSVTAINAIMAKSAMGGQPTGDPATDPAQQGGKGAQNAPNPQSNEPGPQPGYSSAPPA